MLNRLEDDLNRSSRYVNENVDLHVYKSQLENSNRDLKEENECCEREKYLREKITKKLKTGWEFSCLPPLEKATLVYAAYELLFGKNPDYSKMIIDQTINFSKVYLEVEKYKYINKVLDLLVKEEKSN